MFYLLVKDEGEYINKINLFISLAPLLKLNEGQDPFLKEWIKKSEHWKADLDKAKLTLLNSKIFDDDEDDFKTHHETFYKLMKNAFFNTSDGTNEKLAEKIHNLPEAI
jgi:hypothetical protein